MHHAVLLSSSYPCMASGLANGHGRGKNLVDFQQFLEEQDFRQEDERRPLLETMVVPVFMREREAIVVEVVLIVDGAGDVVVGNHSVTVPKTERHCVSNGHG